MGLLDSFRRHIRTQAVLLTPGPERLPESGRSAASLPQPCPCSGLPGSHAGIAARPTFFPRQHETSSGVAGGSTSRGFTVNTSVSVGIVPDENIVVLSINDDSTGLPPTGAIQVGALLVKAGLSAAAQLVTEDALPGIALLLDQFDRMLAALSYPEAAE